MRKEQAIAERGCRRPRETTHEAGQLGASCGVVVPPWWAVRRCPLSPSRGVVPDAVCRCRGGVSAATADHHDSLLSRYLDTPSRSLPANTANSAGQVEPAVRVAWASPHDLAQPVQVGALTNNSAQAHGGPQHDAVSSLQPLQRSPLRVSAKHPATPSGDGGEPNNAPAADPAEPDHEIAAVAGGAARFRPMALIVFNL